VDSPLNYQEPYKRLEYAQWAHQHKIPWPLWEKGDVCPLNTEPLGTWDGYGTGTTSVPDERNNQMSHLAFVCCGGVKWQACNQFMLEIWLKNHGGTCPFCRVPCKVITSGLGSIIYKH